MSAKTDTRANRKPLAVCWYVFSQSLQVEASKKKVASWDRQSPDWRGFFESFQARSVKGKSG
ncbi:MAG TPA: hypothetical protein PLA90_18185 [Candidatus Sumerlaeota bacterium]|nr:hypothetical protein [Candidatus Sumerlaeota bacterium]